MKKEIKIKTPHICGSSNYKKHMSKNPLQRFLIKRFHESVKNIIKKTKTDKILDAGCGEGFAMGEIITEKDVKIYGLDIRLEALKIAGEINKDASFLKGNLKNLPFRENTFDLVICMEVLEHVENPGEVLQELCRISKEWILLSVPHEPFFQIANFLRGKNLKTWGNEPEHINHWSSRGFSLFAGKNCTIIEQKQSFPWTIALCKKISSE